MFRVMIDRVVARQLLLGLLFLSGCSIPSFPAGLRQDAVLVQVREGFSGDEVAWYVVDAESGDVAEVRSPDTDLFALRRAREDGLDLLSHGTSSQLEETASLCVDSRHRWGVLAVDSDVQYVIELADGSRRSLPEVPRRFSHDAYVRPIRWSADGRTLAIGLAPKDGLWLPIRLALLDMDAWSVTNVLQLDGGRTLEDVDFGDSGQDLVLLTSSEHIGGIFSVFYGGSHGVPYESFDVEIRDLSGRLIRRVAVAEDVEYGVAEVGWCGSLDTQGAGLRSAGY